MAFLDTSDLRPAHLKRPLRADELFLGHVDVRDGGEPHTFDVWLQTSIGTSPCRWDPRVFAWRGKHYQCLSYDLHYGGRLIGVVDEALTCGVEYVRENWWPLFLHFYP